MIVVGARLPSHVAGGSENLLDGSTTCAAHGGMHMWGVGGLCGGGA